MSKHYVLLFFFALVSCAGSVMKTDTDDKDLVEVFSAKDVEQIEKFKTVTVAPKAKVKKQPKANAKTQPKTLAKKENKPIEKLEEKSEVKKVVEEPKVDPRTLEDYPKNYVEFDKKYAKVWKSYKPKFFVGEEYTYQVGWSMFSAGTATIRTMSNSMVGEKEAIHINALLESAEYFEGVYKLKDTLDVFVNIDSGNFRPLKYEMKQRESGQIVDDLQLFDADELKTYFFYHRIKDGKTKNEKKISYTPEFFTDSFSTIYFLRGLPMKLGDVYEFPIITRGKVWLLKAKVEEEENIEVMGKTFASYRVSAQTQFPGVLKKSGDMIFWISADDRRMMLKFDAKIKIGSVKGELIRYKEGSKQ